MKILNTKYKIGEKIKIKENDNIIHGHIVLIIPTALEVNYYCSMYPGAQGDYSWIRCIDPLDKNNTDTLQALNIYKEKDIYINIKKERLNKLKKLNEKRR